MIRLVSLFFPVLCLSGVALTAGHTVTFSSGEITLYGELYKPEGKGPFPAVIYNHVNELGDRLQIRPGT